MMQICSCSHAAAVLCWLVQAAVLGCEFCDALLAGQWQDCGRFLATFSLMLG